MIVNISIVISLSFAGILADLFLILVSFIRPLLWSKVLQHYLMVFKCITYLQMLI